MRDKYKKPQMNADERRFVDWISAFIIDKFNSITKDNSGTARLFLPARHRDWSADRGRLANRNHGGLKLENE